MKPATPVLQPDVLLGQADFVRALSRSLLADRSAAEDVAQEALMAGLERPPEEAGALRGWLARVVRNLALQRGRGEARRAARERSVARDERSPSTAEVLEREAARPPSCARCWSSRNPIARRCCCASTSAVRRARSPRSSLALGGAGASVEADCAAGVASATLTGQAGEELTWDAILEPEGEDDEVSIESEPWE